MPTLIEVADDSSKHNDDSSAGDDTVLADLKETNKNPDSDNKELPKFIPHYTPKQLEVSLDCVHALIMPLLRQNAELNAHEYMGEPRKLVEYFDSGCTKQLLALKQDFYVRFEHHIDKRNFQLEGCLLVLEAHSAH